MLEPLLEADMVVQENQEEEIERILGRRRKIHRRWIKDRVNGMSKMEGTENRPCCRVCFVPPCVKWCPDFFEQNNFCELLGGIGCISSLNLPGRLALMRLSLASNTIGMALTFVSCFAISKNYNFLMNFGFSKGFATGIDPEGEIEISIGLRAVAFNYPNASHFRAVYGFEDFCDLGDEIDLLIDRDECDDCYEMSASLVSTLLLSLLTYLPSIFTDILRMYPNYDANCQKTFATLVTLFSIFTSLYTWQGYSHECFKSFNQTSNFTWNSGNGLILIVNATFLKLVVIICHLIVPTPSITRNHDEQESYEYINAVTALVENNAQNKEVTSETDTSDC